MELTETKYKQTEVGLIPEDWKVVEFNEIGDAIIGLTYSPRNVCTNGTMVHRSSNIQNNKLTYEDNVYVDSKIPEKLRLIEGDILICVRNGSKNLIGKSAYITGKSIGETFGAFMSIFRTNNYPPIIYQYVISNIVQSQINASLGATINQITNKTLNSFKIPLAQSLEEQKAIGTVLSDVDALIANLEKLITKKKAIKQGAMQQLLTPPNKGGNRLPGFTGEWEEKSLGELVDYRNGKAHENCVVENGEYVIVNSKFISQDGNVIKYSNKCLSPVFKDEILMVLSDIPNGKAIAKCFIVDRDNKYTLNQRICAFTVKNANSKFLYYKINRNPYYLSFDDGVKQTNLRNIDVLNCPLEIPASIEEQNQISEILTGMENELSMLESKKSKYEAIKQGMMQELLTGKTRLV